MNRAASYARESDLHPQSRVVYRVVRLREDSLQLPRPNPAVQQRARPLRVTTACIHIYVFKHYLLLRQQKDGTAGTPGFIRRSYYPRAALLFAMTTSQMEQLEDRPRWSCCRRRAALLSGLLRAGGSSWRTGPDQLRGKRTERPRDLQNPERADTSI
jgi:hypothetical protein